RSRARGGLSQQQELQLELDGIEMLLGGVPSADVEKTISERRRQRIALQSALTDFRTIWDTVANALAGRNLILVDSDKVQRNLYLVEPEQLRPSVIMPSRMPP